MVVVPLLVTNRAHPRVRGDDLPRADTHRLGRGSPPRARGRPAVLLQDRASRRLTPACAGTTGRSTCRPAGCWAHPRVRGDDPDVIRVEDVISGSPPRARGRPRRGRELELDVRLTPACAGTTQSTPPRRASSQAHPRVRGDDSGRICSSAVARGSPPRARGRPPDPPTSLRPGGLTPACAGTTRPARALPCGRWAHPRVRGDDGRKLARHEGSSWLTPACAGTTLRAATESTAVSAHPRVRGDDQRLGLTILAVTGSPPRARGRPRTLTLTTGSTGLTPACAGTTGHCAESRRRRRAHPRVRGDDPFFPLFAAVEHGSPPRARGRRHRLGPRGHQEGLTPACAGTTSSTG